MLNDNELYLIKGGSVSWGVVGIVSAVISFIVGVFDGIARPFQCR